MSKNNKQSAFNSEKERLHAEERAYDMYYGLKYEDFDGFEQPELLIAFFGFLGVSLALFALAMSFL